MALFALLQKIHVRKLKSGPAGTDDGRAYIGSSIWDSRSGVVQELFETGWFFAKETTVLPATTRFFQFVWTPPEQIKSPGTKKSWQNRRDIVYCRLFIKLNICMQTRSINLFGWLSDSFGNPLLIFVREIARCYIQIHRKAILNWNICTQKSQ